AGGSGRKGPTFDGINCTVADHSMLEIIKVGMGIGGSVVLHISWFDEVLRRLDFQNPTRERSVTVDRRGNSPISGSFVAPVGPPSWVTISFRGGIAIA
ncbi:hypothetical protein PIB30_114520, partial [Stylosanthes scabra]|nr:hypothetical protein [Stylosanthes scabra]